MERDKIREHKSKRHTQPFHTTATITLLSRGGGVLIAIHKSLPSKPLIVENNNLEILFVLIKLHNQSIIISSVYIPNRSDQNLFDTYFSLVESLYHKNPNATFILVGDYNLPSAKLNNSESYFNNKLSYLDFSQYNNIKNIKNVTLDLVISNSFLINIEKIYVPIVPIDLMHPPINIHFKIDHNEILPFNNKIFNWKSGDYISITNYLGSIEWNKHFQDNDVNDNLNFFYSQINYVIDLFIPKLNRYNTKYPIWFSKELIYTIKQKKYAHDIYKASNNLNSYTKFASLRTICKKLRFRDYNIYINNVQISVKNNPKYFWKFFNTEKLTSYLPSSMSYLEKEADNGNDIVNLFKSYFSNTYNQNALNLPNIEYSNNILDPIYSINIEKIDIFNELCNINLLTSPDTDNISAIFLNKCAFVLTPILNLIFNKSLDTGVFPNKWKTSFISPVHKKKSKTSVLNYRPISKISIIPKLFSKLINKKLTPLCNNIIINEQHGFRTGRSTITNLSIFKQSILDSFKNGFQIDVIYTDIEKAFDRVNHKLLILKLKAYGFCDPLLSWFESFLTNRTQFVKYENFISDNINVVSGVPQGS